MRIHVLQHVWFEDEGVIGVWANQNCHAMTKTLLYQNEKPLPVNDFDALVIMGGPMSVNDVGVYPWLAEEKKLIKEAVTSGKIVLGVCLGAQLIATALGARVYKNPYKEIGWHEVTLTKESERSQLFSHLPKRFVAFHWHGETFDLPSGCAKMTESEACSNQAFEYEGRVVGLQFHLESSEESICRLIQNCPEDLSGGKYVQHADEILPNEQRLNRIQSMLAQFLDNLFHGVTTKGSV